MASDIEIAQAATPRPIAQIADQLNIPEEALEPYGRIKGKVSLDWLLEQPVRDSSRMILVTAISPTPAGEGKTTTTVGLGDALKKIGKDAVICLREPSLGPVFGMKGGAAGGGHAQVIPMEDINLHFNGDLHVCFCPCEPESKYRLHGHLLEAPCQVCLWGARSATVVVAAPAGGVMPVRRRITNVFDLCFG